ncbi:hypothetical protein KQI52_01370 [bacterium]|nr:hypothetical protein [bacterium]
MTNNPTHKRVPRYGRGWAAVLLAAVLTVLLLASSASALPRIGEVEAFWEDSLAIVRPEIIDPLDNSLQRTLQSGVPVQVDIEVRIARTGYVKTEHIEVMIEFDVWTGWYRVTTPLSPFAIEEYSTVERLFGQDLLLLFDEDQIDPDDEWFIKVRAGAQLHDGDDTESSHGVADELSGFTRVIFELFGSGEKRCEWSELVRLPERGSNVE